MLHYYLPTKSQSMMVINAVVEVHNLDIVMRTITHPADYIKNSPFIISLTHDDDGNILLTSHCAVLEPSPYYISGQPGIEQ